MRRPQRLVLLGHPVGHSLSPSFQNAALHAAGLSIRYDAVDVDGPDFERTVDQLQRENVWGNVTVPYKERMRSACDVVTPLAERVGAVNTFWIGDDGRLVGDNTDVGGFTNAVETLLGARPRDLTIGLLGAGGSAAAVLAAVEGWEGCWVHVYNRTPERAQLLCERFRSIAEPVDDIGAIAGAQLVVNATSIGLRDDSFPMDPSMISPGGAVIDLVYRRGETAWIRAARAGQRRAADGTVMLVEQGALAFERWFGLAPDRVAMWEAIGAAGA
jgi:shikimate dehydrogenase